MFGSAPSTSTPVIQLAEVPNEVRALISDGMFYGTSGVLTSVATHHSDLDFTAIYSGYTDGWSVVGGRSSLCPVGDGVSPCEHG